MNFDISSAYKGSILNTYVVLNTYFVNAMEQSISSLVRDICLRHSVICERESTLICCLHDSWPWSG